MSGGNSLYSAGPWRICPLSEPSAWKIISANGIRITDVPNGGLEQTANAALISAAPELLDACSAVLRYLDRLEEGLQPTDPIRAVREQFHAPFRNKLEPAIKKALGLSRSAGDAIRCSECRQLKGSQHKPSCHRQGVVSEASDYRPFECTHERLNEDGICHKCGSDRRSR